MHKERLVGLSISALMFLHHMYGSMHDPFKTACGAEFRILKPVASIRPQKNSLVYQQGLQGAEFRTLGSVATGGGRQPAFRTARAQAHGVPPPWVWQSFNASVILNTSVMDFASTTSQRPAMTCTSQWSSYYAIVQYVLQNDSQFDGATQLGANTGNICTATCAPLLFISVSTNLLTQHTCCLLNYGLTHSLPQSASYQKP